MEKVNSYDTIFIDGDIDEESRTVEMNRTVTIKSLNEGKKVNIPVSYHENQDGSDLVSYKCNDYCILKDFKFSLASEEGKVPSSYVFYFFWYLCLENVDFVRDTLKEGNPFPLKHSIFSGSAGGPGVTLYLHTCTFTNIDLNDSPLIGIASVALYNCQFKNINNINGNGSIINGDGYVLDIIDTTFDTCGSGSDCGGALFLTPSSSLLIGGYQNKTIFKNCKVKREYSNSNKNDGEDVPNSFGGAIYCQTLYDKYSFNLTAIEFGKEDNANYAKYGSNFFLITNFLDLGWNTTTFPLMSSMDDGINNYAFRFYYEYENVYPFKCLLDFSCLYYADEIFIGEGNNNDCLSPDTPCPDLTMALDKIRYKTRNVTFVGNYNMLYDIYFYNPSYLKSYNKDSRLIVFNGSFRFSSTATLESLTFNLPSSFHNSYIIYSYGYKIILKSLLFSFQNGVTKCDFSNQLLSISGDIELDSCNFSNLYQSDEYLGFLNSINFNTLTINNCNFDTCSSSKKAGGLYLFPTNDFSSSSSKIINITSSSFKKCSSKYGGAIFLQYSSGYTLSLSGTSFGNDSDKNSADYGCNIFLSSFSVGDIVTTNNFPMLSGLSESSSVVDGKQLFSCAEYFNDYSPDNS